MAHTRDEDLKVLLGSEAAARPAGTRTPPRVWPQVSQADLGRAMRRLRAADHVREPEPRLLGKTG